MDGVWRQGQGRYRGGKGVGGSGEEGAGRREEGGKAILLILGIAYFSKKNQDETFLRTKVGPFSRMFCLGGRVALQAWSTVSLRSVGR